MFTLLVLNLIVGLLGFMQLLNSSRGLSALSPAFEGVIGWLTMTAFLQVLVSFCVVCLAYWVATDNRKA
ncbi:MAG: hypothetical protein WBV70_07155 [Candidatus Bathyarchaeia archaeon]